MRWQTALVGLSAAFAGDLKVSSKPPSKKANVTDSTSASSINSSTNSTQAAVSVKENRLCGEGMSGLVNIPVDSTDMDSGMKKLFGMIESKVLVIESGNDLIDEIDLLSAELPVSALNDRCFAIQAETGERMICVRNQKERNEWINSVSAAILCKYGVSSYIQEEGEDEVAVPESAAKPVKAVKIHIPSELGMQINGHSVASIARNLDKQQARKFAQQPLIEEPTLTKSAVPKLDLAKKNEIGRQPSLQTIMAVKEALAEHGELSVKSAPKYGYENNRMSVVSPHVDEMFARQHAKQQQRYIEEQQRQHAEAQQPQQQPESASTLSGGLFSSFFGSQEAPAAPPTPTPSKSLRAARG